MVKPNTTKGYITAIRILKHIIGRFRQNVFFITQSIEIADVGSPLNNENPSII